MKKIIALAGEIGSGKGTVAEYLIERYGAKKLRYSDMLRDVLNRYYVDHSRDNIQAVSAFVRKQFGDDIMSKVMIRDIEKSNADILVLDGVRRESDLDGLREMAGFKLIYIEVYVENRYQRIVARRENPDEATKTLEEYKKDQLHESDNTVPALKNISDVVIENNGTIEELHAKVDEIIANY